MDESAIQINDQIWIRHEYNQVDETHFVYLMKLNEGYPPTFFDLTLFETKQVAEIVKDFIDEIENCDPCDLIPTLKNSKFGILQDQKDSLYWENDIVRTTSTDRVKIRPVLHGGSYKIRLLIPASTSAQAKYNGWLGRSLQLPVRVAKDVAEALEHLVEKYGKFKKPATAMDQDEKPAKNLVKRTQYDSSIA